MAKTVFVMDPIGVGILESRLIALTRRMTEAVEDDATRNWAAHVETGFTLTSLRSTVKGRIGRVHVSGSVWHFVEYGTSPHTIMSRGGPMAYPLQNTAKDFYAYPGIVRHPGNREFAPMRNALYRKRNRLGYATSPELWSR